MSYRVIVSDTATDEVAIIYRWIRRRSAQGAYRWYEAFAELVIALETTADQHPLTTQQRMHERGVREAFFKTAHGNRYQALFDIVHGDVRILHVRGPGQAPIQP